MFGDGESREVKKKSQKKVVEAGDPWVEPPPRVIDKAKTERKEYKAMTMDIAGIRKILDDYPGANPPTRRLFNGWIKNLLTHAIGEREKNEINLVVYWESADDEQIEGWLREYTAWFDVVQDMFATIGGTPR
jgi:hypothetical protein